MHFKTKFLRFRFITGKVRIFSSISDATGVFAPPLPGSASFGINARHGPSTDVTDREGPESVCVCVGGLDVDSV